MLDSDRTIPPSASRIAAAARGGMFARSSAFIAGFTLLGVAGLMFVSGEASIHRLSDFVAKSTIRAANRSQGGVDALTGALVEGLTVLLPVLAVTSVVGLTLAIAKRLAPAGGKPRTAVPIPPAPTSPCFNIVLKVLGASLLLLLSLHVFRNMRWPLAFAMAGEPDSARDLLVGFTSLVAGGGAILILVGTIETAYMRHRIWKSLHLTKRDAIDEHRRIQGDSSVKRESLRRGRKEAFN